MDKEQLNITLDMKKLDIGEVLAPSTPPSPSGGKNNDEEDLDQVLLHPESLYFSALHVISGMRDELTKPTLLNPTWSSTDLYDWEREIKTFYDLRNSPLLYDKQANIDLFNRLCVLFYDHLRCIGFSLGQRPSK